MKNSCDFCGHALPGGCYQMGSEYKECMNRANPKTTSLQWKIGFAIWKDLSDRGGIKHELRACEPKIQAEIVNAMGRIALKVMKKASAEEDSNG